MRQAKRTHGRKQSGEWGVVEVWSKQGLGQGAPVWLTFWMDLAPGGKPTLMRSGSYHVHFVDPAAPALLSRGLE